MQTTKATLLSAIKDPANQLRWAEFWELYNPYIQSLAREHMPSDALNEEVENVVNQTWDEIMNGKLRYDPAKGNFRSLLYKAIRDNAIDEWRKRKRKSKPSPDLRAHRASDDHRPTGTIERVEDPELSPDEFHSLQEWADAVAALAKKITIEKVGDKQFQIYAASKLSNHDTTQVMETLNVTQNQVYLARKRVDEVYSKARDEAEKRLDAPDFPGS